MRVAVMGAGIIGLWTAYELTERGHEVCVYANLPPTATTSASAVAVVTPLFPWSLEQNPELFTKSLGWFRDTLEKFRELNHGQDFMNLVPSYEFGYLDEHGDKVLEKGFPASRFQQLNFAPVTIRDTSKTVIVKNDAKETHRISFSVNFDADMVDTQVFIPFFESLLRDRGVNFEYRDFKSVDDVVSLPEGEIVNCLGIFSRFLFPDVGPEMHPIRGQSHFIRQDNEPPYYGIASGHHAVFRHKRGYYLGSYFLEDEEFTWRSPSKDRRYLGDLQTLPTEVEMNLTRRFVEKSYPELAAEVGIEAEPVPLKDIWRVNTGIRPFRVEGPVNGVRHLGAKLIIDNFGHGAHGWTIGYGSTRQALSFIE
jgi:glycine/D-amino acid oxidase-like deaminating enzyme